MASLHSLHSAPGATQRKLRRGRGNGSGIGTYSGRGIKGQRARAGGRSGLTARSMKQYLLRIPKRRGFLSGRAGFEVVNLSDLQKHFTDGERVTPKALRAKGLIAKAQAQVKVLSSGDLTKKLFVSAHRFSAQAKTDIEKAGGTTTLMKPEKKAAPVRDAGKA